MLEPNFWFGSGSGKGFYYKKVILVVTDRPENDLPDNLILGNAGFTLFGSTGICGISTEEERIFLICNSGPN